MCVQKANLGFATAWGATCSVPCAGHGHNKLHGRFTPTLLEKVPRSDRAAMAIGECPWVNPLDHT